MGGLNYNWDDDEHDAHHWNYEVTVVWFAQVLPVAHHCRVMFLAMRQSSVSHFVTV